jgi:hypothetical protein
MVIVKSQISPNWLLCKTKIVTEGQLFNLRNTVYLSLPANTITISPFTAWLLKCA